MSPIEGSWCLVARFTCDNRPRILDVCCVGGSVIIELLYRREGVLADGGEKKRPRKKCCELCPWSCDSDGS